MSIHLFSSNHSIDVLAPEKACTISGPVSYDPKYVYIPITDVNRKYLDRVLRINSNVKKGTIIGREQVTNFPYYSPISGKIKEIVEMPFSDFTFRECYKIENDFLSEWDLENGLSNPSNYSKGDIYNFIKNSGIIERDSKFSPIYKIFEPENHIHTLIINAIEFSPYIKNEDLFTSTNIDYIYFVIPFLRKLSEIKNFIICINDDQKILESKIISSKKSYNDITFELKKVNSKYPSFNERNLVRNFTKQSFNLFPQEIGYATISLFALEMLGRFLFEGKRPDLFSFDLVGEVNNPTRVISPFGVLASNLVNIFSQGTTYNEDNLLYIESDPIYGLPHSNLNYLLFPSSKGIISSSKINKKIYSCIGCGKCIDVCPNDLSPINIYKASRKNKINVLEKLNVNKCNGCGNCSYVCPSNIELTGTCVNAKFKLKD